MTLYGRVICPPVPTERVRPRLAAGVPRDGGRLRASHRPRATAPVRGTGQPGSSRPTVVLFEGQGRCLRPLLLVPGRHLDRGSCTSSVRPGPWVSARVQKVVHRDDGELTTVVPTGSPTKIPRPVNPEVPGKAPVHKS